MIEKKKEQHPAFGMISVFRTTCGPSGMALFGSASLHQHFVHVEIHHANVEHDLSHDFYHRESLTPIASFYMSEAQWARFVSSFGDGNGTPITLRSTEKTPKISPAPAPRPIIDPFKAEVNERVDSIKEALQDAFLLLNNLRGKKSVSKSDLDAMKKTLEHIGQQIGSNLEFVERSFKEKMESHLSDSMLNFEAQVQHFLSRNGLAELKEMLINSEESHKKLQQIENLLQELPSGIDEQADPLDTSPEDMTAHIGGLIHQIIKTPGW